MTPKQDKFYWGLWGAVVRAHNLRALPKEQQEAERHAITLEATKNRTSSHKDVTSNAEITRLFALIKFRGRPNDLNAAIDAANPEQAQEANDQRQAVFALSNKGLTSDEIARIAAPLCRRHRVGSWQRLPSHVLREMTRWKQFQPIEVARRRRTPALAIPHSSDDQQIVYHLRPSPPTPSPANAGPF
jgi:hypothetical protein